MATRRGGDVMVLAWVSEEGYLYKLVVSAMNMAGLEYPMGGKCRKASCGAYLLFKLLSTLGCQAPS